jgi:hypothetical protein
MLRWSHRPPVHVLLANLHRLPTPTRPNASCLRASVTSASVYHETSMQGVAANAVEIALAHLIRGLRCAPPPAIHVLPLRGGDCACHAATAVLAALRRLCLPGLQQALYEWFGKPPRSGVNRIAGGAAQRNPRIRICVRTVCHVVAQLGSRQVSFVVRNAVFAE